MQTLLSRSEAGIFSPPERVAVRHGLGVGYPSQPPFDPDTRYPEYIFGDSVAKTENKVYKLVRDLLGDLGLDISSRRTPDWSPFRAFILPGQTVVLKPNLVMDVPNQDAVTTHGSVIRPVVDYVWKALQGKGTIVICDAPSAEANFDAVVQRNGLREMVEALRQRGVNILLEDLRALKVESKNGVWVDEQDVSKNRAESIIVNLGELSAFKEVESQTYRLHGGGYGRHITSAHHSDGRHEYCVSKRILEADFVIFLPKLKTHRKAGFTCCLKNLVGINVDKNFLPHFAVGAANAGGDEFPPLPVWRKPGVVALRLLHDLLLGRFWRITGRTIASGLAVYKWVTPTKKVNSCGRADSAVAAALYAAVTGSPCWQGSWQGNETIWRMILDLNRLFIFADASGVVKSFPQRRVFHLVDGIVSGDGNGPMNPTSQPLGMIAAGENGAEIDLAILRLAGIDPKSIPLYREVLMPHNFWILGELSPTVSVNGAATESLMLPVRFKLTPPDGWSF